MASLRLRVPAALAVAVLGVSAPIAASFGGCQDESMPDPSDAGHLSKGLDAGDLDAGDVDAGELEIDAGTPADAGVDAALPDAPPDAPPDGPEH
jgi:hypothetical protein